MRVKALSIFFVWLALLIGTASLQAQEATVEAPATETATIAQFQLSQHYQDSLYTVDYPQGWVATPGAAALSLDSDPHIVTMIERFGNPALLPGQLGIEIMNGVIGAGLIAHAPSQIVNINCTSCHTLAQSAAPAPSETALTLSALTGSVALIYGGAPLFYHFADAQAITLGAGEAAEAPFTANPNDGLLIEFTSNGQLVNVLGVVASGELAADQPLIEAIASTIQLANAVPAAASTASP